MRLNQLRVVGGVALGLVCVLVTPNVASTAGALAGEALNSAGQPQSGVTVEASGTAVTDGHGRDLMTDLAPKRGGGMLPQDPWTSRADRPAPKYLIDSCRAPWLRDLATFLGHHECLMA
jgi:hypothetical protein